MMWPFRHSIGDLFYYRMPCICSAGDNMDFSLTVACYFNKEMMMHFHPGALFRNRWSCCKQQGKTSLGCQPTYHLLTRSSSRYAQMRRKDTLSSSHSSGRRMSKSGSVPREDRASYVPDTLAVPDDPGASGRGLSNSCFDLAHRQIQNQFEVPDTESQRCSQLSTEPSISMGCITLTHHSLNETAQPPSPFLTPVDPDPTTEVSQRSPILRTEGKTRRSRVQVAPENTTDVSPTTTFPCSESQPHLTYNSYPTSHAGLPNRFTHSVSAQFSAITLTNSTTHGRDSSRYQCLTVPRKSRRVKTYLGTVSPSVWQNQLSCSLNTLPAKPVLEPKISINDPNTIHV